MTNLTRVVTNYVPVMLVLALCLTSGCFRGSKAPQLTKQSSDHYGATVHLGLEIESSGSSKQIVPLARLTNGEADDASAMVFVTLIDRDGIPMSSEIPTRYDVPAGSSEKAYIADPIEHHPKASEIRFRIVTADGESTHEIDIGKESE